MAILPITRRYVWFLHNTPPLQVVRGTLDALASPVQNIGINHRGFHVLMVAEFLDCPNVVALSRRFVTKECRKVWQVAGLARAAFLTAPATAFWMMDSWA
jgi:hypothetical protein